MRDLVISDIHGYYLTFKALLEKVDFTKADRLFLVGDFIDKGPSSKQVIGHILELQAEGYNIQCLQGNHESLLLKALGDNQYFQKWKKGAGLTFLPSYGITSLKDLPTEHLHFYNNLPTYLEVGKYIVVHAGLDFSLEDPLSSDYSNLWIRNWYEDIDYDWLGERYIIHGHTPITKEQIKLNLSKLSEQRIMNLDNGVFIDDTQNGRLTCFDITNNTLTFKKAID